MAPLFTTSPLLGGAAYTSPVLQVDTSQGRITGTVFADQAGTLYIEQSDEGTNWDVSSSYAISANDGKGFTENVVGRFWRVRYVNGVSTQTAFRLYVKPRL